MVQRVLRVVTLTLAVAGFTAAATEASPITYIYTGVGAGFVGEGDFDDAFTITALADTANITPWLGGLQNSHLSATIDIPTVGTFSIDVPSHTWIVEDCCGGLGADLGANWVTIDEAALVSIGYLLDTSLGPIVDNSPSDISQFNGVLTSGGPLSFTSLSQGTFQAIAATEVPEPASWLLIGVGVALAVRRYRRARA